MALGSILVSEIDATSNTTQNEINEVYNYCDRICQYGTTCLPVSVSCGSFAPAFKVSFIVDNFLSNSKEWVSHVESENVSLLFLNTGAHFVEDEKFLENVNTTLTSLHKFAPLNLGVVYRNTPPGHYNCQLSRNHPPALNSINWSSNFSSLPANYHWQDFERQNSLGRDLIREHFPQVLFLDVSTSTKQRPDSHVSGTDCLHYCIPGPINEWALMHYTMLVGLDFLHLFGNLGAFSGEAKFTAASKLVELPVRGPSVLLHNELKQYFLSFENKLFFRVANGSRHYSQTNLTYLMQTNQVVLPGETWSTLDIPIGKPD